ncbi:S8 family serine peptidase [Paenibacillus sp. YYML68]|uniref:S8 family serine peptidase n=1 Tax=Paenibacillus sp. YYML68 TaxID=2909250 RepID=UPI002493725D|nr:S8 family serine peptidase [Paenibacillus sp. YYML68]
MKNSRPTSDIGSERRQIDRPILIAEDSKNSISDHEIRESSQTTPWGIHATGAYLVNSAKSGGNKVKVAVFDTGISNHPDLHIAGGISVVESSSSYQDDHGHGTHIAGTIAAIKAQNKNQCLTE